MPRAADPNLRRPALAARWLLVLPLGLVVLRLPVQLAQAVGAARDGAAAVARVLSEPADRRIALASGVGAPLREAVAAGGPAGRLVLYSPYGGGEFELDAADPRGMPARQLRTLFERVKNLVYPRPRDVHFARDPAELAGKVTARPAGPLQILEGRITALDVGGSPAPPAAGGPYELVHEQAIGAAGRLRLWRLREGR
jgi:hypothetical protein